MIAVLALASVAGSVRVAGMESASVRARAIAMPEVLRDVRVTEQDRKLLADARAALAMPAPAKSAQGRLLAAPRRPDARRHVSRHVRVWRNHVVSMVYVGDGSRAQRYAVVDGRFCIEGSRLRRGVRVRRIRAGSVLLVRDGGAQRWFRVRAATGRSGGS